MGDSDMEILAKWMIKHGYATVHGDTMEDLLEELEWQIEERSHRAVEVERKACAALCADWNDSIAQHLANTIRARGQE